jgi:Holliday junction resolvase-like predicted endonuclease
MESNNNKKREDLEKNLDAFLTNENQNQHMDCNEDGCIIKTDKSLVERINKKIITEDGRQLLF